MGASPSHALPLFSALLLNEIPNLPQTSTHPKPLNQARFLRAIKVANAIVVKVFVKPEYKVSVANGWNRCEEEAKKLKGVKNKQKDTVVERDISARVYRYSRCTSKVSQLRVKNVLNHSTIGENDKIAYITRPFIKENLYDRISTRPFLITIEKTWIAYQLVSTVAECHLKGVRHGDIKSENILMTSWNWTCLADFASYKPVHLPMNDPTDFSFFFDTSCRRNCYIAPERFFDPLSRAKSMALGTVYANDLTNAMDIFSLGCVIAELFLDGTALFTLSELLKYRIGEFDVGPRLLKIEDSVIRNMVTSMDFPPYFSEFLHPYLAVLGEISSIDERIEKAHSEFDKISMGLVFDQTSRLNLNGDQEVANEYAVMILSFINSQVRSLTFVNTKLKAIELLLNTGLQVSDVHKLDRALPFLIYLTSDNSPLVRVTSLQALTDLLSSLKSIPRSDSDLFVKYLFPNLKLLTTDSEVMVRVGYASCLPRLCKVVAAFIDVKIEADLQVERERQEELPQVSRQDEIRKILQEEVSIVLTDQDSIVRRTLLYDIAPLCEFFGPDLASEVLLSHIVTYLNDNDWLLRRAFLDGVVQMIPFFDGEKIESYFLPLLLQALTDSEDFVVARAISCITTLTEMGSFRQAQMREVLIRMIPQLYHSNPHIRQEVVGYVCAYAKSCNIAQFRCLLYPSLQAHMRKKLPLDPSWWVDDSCLSNALPASLNHQSVHSESPSLTWGSNMTPLTSTNSIFTDVAFHPRNIFLQPSHSWTGSDKDSMSLSQSIEGPFDSPSYLHISSRVDSYSRPFSSAGATPLSGSVSASNFQPSDSSGSHGKNLTALLAKQILKMFPAPIQGLGKEVPPFDHRPRKAPVRARPQAAPDLWRPKGHLITKLGEHTLSVNQVAVSPDHNFFVSVSDDGTTKIWDAQRLERIVNCKSRCTISDQGGRIVCIDFLPSHHAILTGSSNGSVRLTQIDYRAQKTSTPAYGPPKLLSELRFDDDAVVALKCVCIEQSKIAYIALGSNRIAKWDIHTNVTEFETTVPSSHGIITAMLVRSPYLLILGTVSGVVLTYDIRFKITLRVVQHPSCTSIHGLYNWPKDENFSHLIVAAGSGELALWDLSTPETTTPKEIWCTRKDAGLYLACLQPEEIAPHSSHSVHDIVTQLVSAHLLSDPESLNHSQILVTLPEDTIAADSSSIRGFAACHGGQWLLTAGADRTIRFWDRDKVSHSYVVSSVDSDTLSGYRQYATFEIPVSKGPTVNLLKATPPLFGSGQTSQATAHHISLHIEFPADADDVPGCHRRLKVSKSWAFQSPHRDVIADLAVIHVPNTMILAAGRDGSIGVWR